VTLPPSLSRAVPRILFAAAVAFGLLATLADRDLQGGDGISYLDIAFAWARTDAAAAINAFWSPLYTWLLALMLLVLRPEPDWEFSAVSALGFVIYVTVLGCFLFFWRAVAEWRKSVIGEAAGFSPAAWCALGYALFLWTTLPMAHLNRSPADLLMAGFVYLACGHLARMASGDLGSARLAWFGVALGLGYLAKAPMLPLSLAFLTVAWVLARSPRRMLPALAAFLALSLPWIIVLSRQKGRLTYGDTGPLNYAFHVNRAPMFYWLGEPLGTGTPVHPPRILHRKPVLYEFAHPAMGSYPIWYDPSYWNQGLSPHFDLEQQWNATQRTLIRYQWIFRNRLDFVLVALGILLHAALYSRGQPNVDRRVRAWFLFLPALAGFAMYALLYVEHRHVAVFFVILWTAIFASFRFPAPSRTASFANAMAGAVFACTLMVLLIHAPEQWRVFRERPDRVHWQVAQELVRRGVRPGDRIMVLGSALWQAPSAHLARVQIAAEVPEADAAAFWTAHRPVQSAVMERAAALGIRLAVADCGNCAPPPDCTRYSNTSVLALGDRRHIYVCDIREFLDR
jgi:hypothetical protein